MRFLIIFLLAVSIKAEVEESSVAGNAGDCLDLSGNWKWNNKGDEVKFVQRGCYGQAGTVGEYQLIGSNFDMQNYKGTINSDGTLITLTWPRGNTFNKVKHQCADLNGVWLEETSGVLMEFEQVDPCVGSVKFGDTTLGYEVIEYKQIFYDRRPGLFNDDFTKITMIRGDEVFTKASSNILPCPDLSGSWIFPHSGQVSQITQTGCTGKIKSGEGPERVYEVDEDHTFRMGTLRGKVNNDATELTLSNRSKLQKQPSNAAGEELSVAIASNTEMHNELAGDIFVFMFGVLVAVVLKKSYVHVKTTLFRDSLQSMMVEI